MSGSMINEYSALELELKELTNRLDSLRSDPKLQSEFEFKERLESLMMEYDKTSNDVINMLNPQAQPATEPQKRRKRKLKVFKNPHTGEVIETRGGNHKQLKEWKSEHGSETVESWVVSEDS